MGIKESNIFTFPAWESNPIFINLDESGDIEAGLINAGFSKLTDIDNLGCSYIAKTACYHNPKVNTWTVELYGCCDVICSYACMTQREFSECLKHCLDLGTSMAVFESEIAKWDKRLGEDE